MLNFLRTAIGSVVESYNVKLQSKTDLSPMFEIASLQNGRLLKKLFLNKNPDADLGATIEARKQFPSKLFFWLFAYGKKYAFEFDIDKYTYPIMGMMDKKCVVFKHKDLSQNDILFFELDEQLCKAWSDQIFPDYIKYIMAKQKIDAQNYSELMLKMNRGFQDYWKEVQAEYGNKSGA